jgi:hypothetical protein
VGGTGGVVVVERRRRADGGWGEGEWLWEWVVELGVAVVWWWVERWK